MSRSLRATAALVPVLGGVLGCEPAPDGDEGPPEDTGRASAPPVLCEDAAVADEGLPPVDGVCVPPGGWSGRDPSGPAADCVESFSPAAGATFGHDRMPEVVLGAPHGAEGGGTDVVSLGCGGSIVLAFDGPGIVDGPGPDFIVFENPFVVGDETFTEPALVSVSADGERWYTFPCSGLDGRAAWPPACCAGINPVHADGSDTIEPGQIDAAGGDAFDLAGTGLSRIRYVRLDDVGARYDETRTWCTGPAGGADIDAVVAVHRLSGSLNRVGRGVDRAVPYPP